MSGKTKTQMVPKLRFPEFREADAWSGKELGSVCEILNNQRRPITGSDREPGPYPYYGASGVVDFVKDFIFDERLLLVGEDGAKWNAFEKTAFIVEGKYWVNNHAHVLKPIEINDTLLENYLTMADLGPFVTGAAPPKLTLGKLKSIPVPVPPSSIEQTKVAYCLSSLDELIAAQARKVEALKTHKKGLMQQLFPREGETQPRLRFPEFQNAEDWEMKSLGSFSKVGDIDHKMPSSTAHGIPYIMTGNFFGMNDIDYENAKKISIEDYEQLSKKIKPELGDIIIARYASVGAVRYIQTRLKFLASYSCAVIKCNKLEDSRYIYYALQSDVIQSQIRLEINTSSQKNIGIDSIKKLNVFLPTLSEQLKISACLAVLDTQITAATQELDTLKTRKKGLMQQLFPSMELVHP